MLTEITLLVKKKQGGSEKTLHNFCFCFVVPLDRAPPWTSHPWKGPRKGWSSLGWWEVEFYPEGGTGGLLSPSQPKPFGIWGRSEPVYPPGAAPGEGQGAAAPLGPLQIPGKLRNAENEGGVQGVKDN